MMKLIADDRVRQYELTFILPASLTSTELKKSHESVEALLKKFKGKVEKQEDWGKRPFAYTITKSGKRFAEGSYHHWLVALPAAQAPELERALVLSPEIIRSLLIKAEDGSIHVTDISELPKLERSERDRSDRDRFDRDDDSRAGGRPPRRSSAKEFGRESDDFAQKS
jgi:ribosomal protein S6